MIRLIKLWNLENKNTTKIVISETLMPVNYSSSTILIPVRHNNIIFHIIIFADNIKNINNYLYSYNSKEKIENINIKYWDRLIFDIDFNIKYIHSKLEDDDKFFLHPKKKIEKIENIIKKDILYLKNNLKSYKNIFFYKNDYKRNFLTPLLNKNYIIDWNITNCEDTLKRREYFNYIKSINIEKRKRNINFKNVFFKEMIKSRLSSLYENFWKIEIDKKISYELEIIIKKGFSEYFENFIIIAKFLRMKKYLYFIRGSWAWSLILYLLWISHINPVKYWLSFERFLGRNKTADIDIDIPWGERKQIIEELNKIFLKKNKEIFLITNKSSEDYEKITVSPAWILIEDSLIYNNIPIFNVPQHKQKISELFESGTTPILDKLGFLKYDLLSSQVSWPIQNIYEKKGINVIDIILDWENKLIWKDDYEKKLNEWKYFHFKSSKFLKMILHWYKPACFFDLVKLLAVNRPAMYYSLSIKDIIENLNLWKISVTKDEKLNKIIWDSQSWKMILFQDQVISIMEYILPELNSKSIIKLVKAKVKDKTLIDLAIKNWKLHEKQFIKNFYDKTKDKSLAKQIWKQITNFNHYWLNKSHSFSYALVTYLELNSK